MFKLKLFNFREAGLKTPFVFQKVTIFLKLELPLDVVNRLKRVFRDIKRVFA